MRIRPLFLIPLAVLSLASCSTVPQKEKNGLLSAYGPAPVQYGRFVMIQGPTSNSESMINMMLPRLKTYRMVVTGSDGSIPDFEKYETVQNPLTFWKIEKFHFKKLKLGVTYKMTFFDSFKEREWIADEREFRALDLSKKQARFAFATCMSDDARFEPVIDPIWTKMLSEKPDFVVLGGDNVYVDSFDFVERQKATDLDIWMRYIDVTKRFPIYRSKTLVPILATWDDHDFGSNDGNRTFKSKAIAAKIFRAFYGGRAIAGVYEPATDSVRSSFTGFGQRFFLMDDRSFRQPREDTKFEPYAQWGEVQQKWLIAKLKESKTPAWIFNGGQMFNGKNATNKESFEGDYKESFGKFLNDLKPVEAPLIFASGDIHFSEIQALDASRLGYPTFEITSSSLHSTAPAKEWPNPLRIASTVKFNYLVIESTPNERGFDLKVTSRGIDREPYFEQTLKVQK